MKNYLVLNPLAEGGKRYNFIIRGNYKKQQLRRSLEELIKSKVKVTSLNRNSFKQFYFSFDNKFPFHLNRH